METNINTEVKTGLSTEHVLDISDRLYKIAIGLVAVVAVAVIGWGVYAFNSLPQNEPHEIQVSGEGKAYVKPDIAMISFGAHTEAPKSVDAVSQNNTIMDAVNKAVKSLGVEDKDIQTTLYNLQPVYDYNVQPMMGAPAGAGGEVMSYPYPGGGTTVLRGYTLDQQVQVKIRNFNNINAIVDATTKNAANTVGSLYFTVDDMEKIRSEARENAIKQAKEKAGSMFAAAGLSAKIVNISEGYAYQPVYGMGRAIMEKAVDAAPAPNIQIGEQEISTTVTLTYKVR